MHLVGREKILRVIEQQLADYLGVEHGVFASSRLICEDMLEIVEAVSLTALGCEGAQKSYSIPKLTSYRIIKWCIEKNTVPIIAHVHPFSLQKDNISFSARDIEFMKSFVLVARKMGLRQAVVFMVTNCYQSCWTCISNTKEEVWKSVEKD